LHIIEGNTLISMIKVIEKYWKSLEVIMMHQAYE
jgi:hypothetical protein